MNGQNIDGIMTLTNGHFPFGVEIELIELVCGACLLLNFTDFIVSEASVSRDLNDQMMYLIFMKSFS